MTAGDGDLCSSLCMCFLSLSECTPVFRPVSSPVHDAVPVEGHEIHLAAAPRTHGCKEDLWNDTRVRAPVSEGPAVVRDQSYLIVPLTEELQPLSSFVHEDTIKVAGLHRSDLNGLLSPSHDLIGADVSCGRNVMLRYIYSPHCRIFFVRGKESYQQKWASRPTAAPRP